MMTPTAVKVDHTIMPAHARKDTLFFLRAQLNCERNIITFQRNASSVPTTILQRRANWLSILIL